MEAHRDIHPSGSDDGSPATAPHTRIILVRGRSSDEDRRRILDQVAAANADGRRAVLALDPGSSLDELGWARFLDADWLVRTGGEGPWQLLLRSGVDVDLSIDETSWRSQPETGAAARTPRRRSWAAAAAIVLAALALLAASILPAPYSVEYPGDNAPVTNVVRGGPESSEGSGSLRVGVVGYTTPTWAALPYWWWRARDDASLLRTSTAFGSDYQGDPEEGTRDAFDAAYIAAADAAGKPKPAFTGRGVRVLRAYRDSPVRPGELIVAAEGVRIRTMADLQPLLDRAEPGDVLRVKLHDGRSNILQLGTPVYPSTGVEPVAVLATDGLEVDTSDTGPFTFHGSYFEGGSAGLAMALHMYSSMSGGDLLRGRTVVATGTIEPDGNVNPVGGVDAKALASVEDGADVLLVPEQQYWEAYRRLEPPVRMKVIGVRDLEDAIEQLKSPTVAEWREQIRRSTRKAGA